MTFNQRYTTHKDLHRSLWILNRALLIGGISLAIGGGIATFGKHPAWKIAIGLLGTGAIAATYRLHKVERDLERELLIFEEAKWHGITHQARIEMSPVQTTPILPAASSTPSLNFFNWERLRDEPNRFPHLILVGASGDGKTTLAEWLVNLIGTGEDIKVLTTKRKSSQWRGMEVLGVPRDFVTVESELENLIDEMTKRSGDLDRIDSYKFLIRPIDELPALAKNIKQFQFYLGTLLREAREAKIRVIALAQGQQVETLGLKGESDLKECLTFIRLGEFALKHAKQLIQSRELEPAHLEWLKMQKYPCMVNDQIAVIPNLATWEPDTISSVVSPPAQGENEGETDFTPSPGETDKVKWLESLYRLDISPMPPGETISPDPPISPPSEGETDYDPFTDSILPKERELALKMVSEGATQTEILRRLYRAKSGKGNRYKAARDKLKRILELEENDR